jgi:hypothetical protein
VRREGGLPLRLHSAPNTRTDNIIARLPIGSAVTLLDGPQQGDGHAWWHVRTADGHTGWVAGEELAPTPQ